jgi:hypothetical protein
LYQNKWETTEWSFLGQGNYNNAYISKDKAHVFKIQHAGLDEEQSVPDTPERSVQLWNLINPKFRAEIAQTTLGRGWICPFIESSNEKQPTDKEISNALIDIFNKTGRIVVDAPGSGNFKKMDGTIICVDIGMALQLEQRQQVFYQGRLARSMSFASQKVWGGVEELYHEYFEIYAKISPETVQTIKALLFIQANRPDMLDVSFLTESPEHIPKLAMAYDKQETNHVDAGRQILNEQRPIDLENIRQSCLKELYRYISSRGTINSNYEFDPCFTTKHFRNKVLTNQKVEIAKDLIKAIEIAGSLTDIMAAINISISDPKALKSSFTSGLITSLGKCVAMVEVAEKAKNQEHTDAPSA